MRKYNILVTGVGAIIGYGVLTSLKKSMFDTYTVGMDVFSDAVGQVWCDKFIQAKYASDDGYISFLKQIIDTYSIDLVFFGTEQEINKCNASKNELGEYYRKLVINTDKMFEMAEDKWTTICFLKENGFDYIPSSIDFGFYEAQKMFGVPLLMKPRRSYASKGIKKVYDEIEYNEWKKEYLDNFMVQKLVGDEEHEYTASTFGFGDGTCVTPIVMRRKLSKAGATDKAIVEVVQEINNEIFNLVSILKPIGPTNFQFRKHEDKFLLLEINPRISSATSLRTAFGYNEAEMCIQYFLEGVKPCPMNLKTGRAYRYIGDVILYNDSDNI